MSVSTRYFAADALKAVVASVCSAAGSEPAEAELIARRLVDANLAGHDSHGVIRLPRYIRSLATGGVFVNRHATVVLDTGSLIVVDGNNGFGQVVGGEAMEVGIAAAKRNGACVLALRHSSHLGRIADWAEMAADAGLASFHFVNVTGIGASRVAPFGGTDRRLGTNPIAAAIPRSGGPPIVLDMATSIVAEGKIAVAANRGVETPEGWLLDRNGRPTRNPRDLYDEPGGSLMPFGAYKGYGLSLFVDLFAGALTGAGGIAHKHDDSARVENNMVAMIVDPERDRRPKSLRRRGRCDRRLCDGVEAGGRRRCGARPRRSGAAHACGAPRQWHSDRGSDVASDRRGREVRWSNHRGWRS